MNEGVFGHPQDREDVLILPCDEGDVLVAFEHMVDLTFLFLLFLPSRDAQGNRDCLFLRFPFMYQCSDVLANVLLGFSFFQWHGSCSSRVRN